MENKVPTEGSRAGLHILFVDDDDLIRESTSEMLETLGHDVVAAPDAASALACLQQAEIDVLITDLNLPGISGELLAGKARGLNQSLRIVFATGAHHVSAVPGAVLLRKPYDMKAIEALLRQFE